MPTFRENLSHIISKHVAAAVEAATTEALDAYKSMIAHELGTGGGRGRGRAAAAAGKRPGVGRKVSAALTGRTCPVPGCGKPGKGPRFRFFCEDHRTMPRAEQDKILAQARGAEGGEAAAPAKAARRGRRKKGEKK